MASDNIQGLETLEAWKRSKDFAIHICKDILAKFPVDEKWNLVLQIRRSVMSVPSNIAEGHGRFYYQNNVRFCYIARGSLVETLSHLVVAEGLGYINHDQLHKLRGQIEEILRIINGYIGFLKPSKQGANEPGANYFIREVTPDYLPDSTENLIINDPH